MSGNGDDSPTTWDEVSWGEETDSTEDDEVTAGRRGERAPESGPDGGGSTGDTSNKQILFISILVSGGILVGAIGMSFVDDPATDSSSDVETPAPPDPLVSVSEDGPHSLQVAWSPTAESSTLWIAVQATDGSFYTEQRLSSPPDSGVYDYNDLSPGQYKVYGWLDTEHGFVGFEEFVTVVDTRVTMAEPTRTRPPTATATATPTPTEGGGPGFGPVAALLALLAVALVWASRDS
jgi:PGF-CTERM protein